MLSTLLDCPRIMPYLLSVCPIRCKSFDLPVHCCQNAGVDMLKPEFLEGVWCWRFPPSFNYHFTYIVNICFSWLWKTDAFGPVEYALLCWQIGWSTGLCIFHYSTRSKLLFICWGHLGVLHCQSITGPKKHKDVMFPRNTTLLCVLLLPLVTGGGSQLCKMF